MRLHAFSLLGLFFFSVVAAAAPQTAKDNSQLELGVLSFRAAQYEEAMQHFEKALLAEPENVDAHLWMATALAETYIPGAGSRDNVRQGQLAIEQYQKVMELDPSNMKATKGAAYLNLQMKRFSAAKRFYHRASELDPNDPEPYYSIAVIDWTQTYQPRMEVRAKLGLRPEQPMIQFPECAQVRDANTERVADGMEMLKKALELKNDYDDAMAYMNLMYRERADIQCGDPKAHAADLKAADQWVDLTIGIKTRKFEEEDRSRKDGSANHRNGGTKTTVDFSIAPNRR
jgi:tetratricopeptide (TPR) repeat protein